MNDLNFRRGIDKYEQAFYNMKTIIDLLMGVCVMSMTGCKIDLSDSDRGSDEYLERTTFVDVICKHSYDGEIIPLCIRIKDDEREYHSFKIKSYKSLFHLGSYVT